MSTFSFRESFPADLFIGIIHAIRLTKWSWTVKPNAFQFSKILLQYYVKCPKFIELLKYSEHTHSTGIPVPLLFSHLPKWDLGLFCCWSKGEGLNAKRTKHDIF